MSNGLAIAAVTSTLQRVLAAGLSNDGAAVTVRPPDRARSGNSAGNQVNVFLYHTALNAAWRNQDMPGQVRSGDGGHPPLPLDLFYLVTAYGLDDDDGAGHRLLGQAMSVLHDTPVLDRSMIETALPGNDLHQQVEWVRITPQPLSLEEMSKLWTTFQSQYRISAAYQASVVLIDSRRETRTPLPVARRGEAGRGPVADTAPYPTLTGIALPPNQASARLGDELVLSGIGLEGSSVDVGLAHPLLDTPVAGTVTAASGVALRVVVPNRPFEVPAGFYAASAVVRRRGEPPRVTNALGFALAPEVTTLLPQTFLRDPQGDLTIVLRCKPNLLPAQRVFLLLGDRQYPCEARTDPTDTATFRIPSAPTGTFFVRLRVDGVDSLLVDPARTPLAFDETRQITIQ